MAASGQPELPAWLETLRAGERGTSSPMGLNESSGFSPDDFVDENLLPSWMQADRNDAGDSTPSGAYPARRSASTPAPNTDSAFTPTKGMSASSLIDGQFLPSWLQEKQVAAPSSPQESISAASLVQPDALPEWMRTTPQVQPPTSQPPFQYNQASQPPQAIQGNDLIDRQELPEWMAGQSIPTALNGQGQSGFAASSLIDKEVLPPWMREGNQEQRSVSAEAFAPRPLDYSQPPQSPQYQQSFGEVQVPDQQQGHGQMPQPMQQSRPAEQQAAQMRPDSSLSASSFIDVNALPEWLRAPGDGRSEASASPRQQGGNEQQRSFGIPPRPDYVRVPSRPRSEAGSAEDSTVAANAFASMLGVASAVPYFPGQQPRNASMGQGQMPLQQAMPPVQPSAAQNMPSAQQGNAMGMMNTPSTSNPSATWGAPAPMMQPPTSYPNGYAPNSMSGALPPQSALQSMSGMQSGGAASSNNGQSKTTAKAPKRGFLSTILDWFTR